MVQNDTGHKPNISDRRFRRYHRQAERRRKQERRDSRFMAAVFSLAGITAAIAIGVAVFGMQGGRMDTGALADLTRPWLGSLSKFEVLGLVFIALVGGLYFWRIRKR
ncbi:MAG: hypothetical protein GDA39_05045 [Hyphomonadaceae bacterium]|nr:hypothetical protein [Hyphomonadaceae bacterium]MBC6412284.1 hypothetical protein [Hyphomonadaceae bacterium]